MRSVVKFLVKPDEDYIRLFLEDNPTIVDSIHSSPLFASCFSEINSSYQSDKNARVTSALILILLCSNYISQWDDESLAGNLSHSIGNVRNALNSEAESLFRKSPEEKIAIISNLTSEEVEDTEDSDEIWQIMLADAITYVPDLYMARFNVMFLEDKNRYLRLAWVYSKYQERYSFLFYAILFLCRFPSLALNKDILSGLTADINYWIANQGNRLESLVGSSEDVCEDWRLLVWSAALYHESDAMSIFTIRFSAIVGQDFTVKLFQKYSFDYLEKIFVPSLESPFALLEHCKKILASEERETDFKDFLRDCVSSIESYFNFLEGLSCLNSFIGKNNSQTDIRTGSLMFFTSQHALASKQEFSYNYNEQQQQAEIPAFITNNADKVPKVLNIMPKSELNIFINKSEGEIIIEGDDLDASDLMLNKAEDGSADESLEKIRSCISFKQIPSDKIVNIDQLRDNNLSLDSVKDKMESLGGDCYIFYASIFDESTVCIYNDKNASLGKCSLVILYSEAVHFGMLYSEKIELFKDKLSLLQAVMGHNLMQLNSISVYHPSTKFANLRNFANSFIVYNFVKYMHKSVREARGVNFFDIFAIHSGVKSGFQDGLASLNKSISATKSFLTTAKVGMQTCLQVFNLACSIGNNDLCDSILASLSTEISKGMYRNSNIAIGGMDFEDLQDIEAYINAATESKDKMQRCASVVQHQQMLSSVNLQQLYQNIASMANKIH